MRSVLYLTVDREREAGDRVTWLHPAVAVQPVSALLADTKHKLTNFDTVVGPPLATIYLYSMH